LEREIFEKSSGNFPVIVLDAGGLIDISHATRTYSLKGCPKTEKNPNYAAANVFLRHVSQRAPILLTPKTYQEIQDHGRMMLNSHTVELSPITVDYSLKVMADSAVFLDGLVGELSLDDARYDAYWTSKVCRMGNCKKQEEGYSDTDREIISTAAYLSRCQMIGESDKKVDGVLVISSDAHVLSGSEFLGRYFDGRYPNITPISTRH
jgi:hypothetical protein